MACLPLWTRWWLAFWAAGFMDSTAEVTAPRLGEGCDGTGWKGAAETALAGRGLRRRWLWKGAAPQTEKTSRLADVAVKKLAPRRRPLRVAWFRRSWELKV